MEIKTEMNGTVVKNHTDELSKTLGMSGMKHEGNYVFTGNFNGAAATVYTEPADETEEKIRILSVDIKGDGERRTVTKVLITYHMIRKNETAETCIDMPISVDRYKELAAGCTSDNKCWHEIRGALMSLTRLQGYDELGSWSLELAIEALK